jgi:hypothetical protein
MGIGVVAIANHLRQTNGWQGFEQIIDLKGWPGKVVEPVDPSEEGPKSHGILI